MKKNDEGLDYSQWYWRKNSQKKEEVRYDNFYNGNSSGYEDYYYNGQVNNYLRIGGGNNQGEHEQNPNNENHKPTVFQYYRDYSPRQLEAPKQKNATIATYEDIYSNYYTAKKKTFKFTKGETALSLSLIICGLALAIALSILLASGLNIGHLIGKVEQAKVSAKSYYAVCSQIAESEKTAFANADTIKKQGGGGYVLTSSGKYYVVAAVYPTESEAKAVISKNAGANFILYEIKAHEVRLNFKEEADKELANKALGFYDSCYKTLYDIALKYDSGEITADQAKLQITGCQKEIAAFLKEYDNAIKNNGLATHLVIRSKLTELNQALKSLSSINLSGDNLSSAIKYEYTKILHSYSSLTAQLK